MYEHIHAISMQELVVKILFLFSLAKTVYKLLPKQDLYRVGCFSPKSCITAQYFLLPSSLFSFMFWIFNVFFLDLVVSLVSRA